MNLFELLFTAAEIFAPSCYHNHPVAAQLPSMLSYVGMVIDTNSEPVCLAKIQVNKKSFYSDASGKFTVTNLIAGHYPMIISVGDNTMVFSFSVEKNVEQLVQNFEVARPQD